MQNITQQFNEQFVPFKALLLYRHDKAPENAYNGGEVKTQLYIESYDIGRSGKPINAHPLSLRETNQLTDLLQAAQPDRETYLHSRGILPDNVLYVNQSKNGFALWHTPPQVIDLFFVPELGIPSGKYPVPALLWKADLHKLEIYALKGKGGVTNSTRIYRAPFLNLYNSGQVCMGNVGVNIPKETCLQDFIRQWQTYFFNSNFSHSISGNSNTKTNTTELWRSLSSTDQPFPQQELLLSHITIKDLLS